MFEDILGEEFYEGDENPIEFEWHGEPEIDDTAKTPPIYKQEPDCGQDEPCGTYDWKADVEKYIEEKLKSWIVI